MHHNLRPITLISLLLLHLTLAQDGERTCEGSQCAVFVNEDDRRDALTKNEPVLVQVHFLIRDNGTNSTATERLAPYFPRVDDYARLDIKDSVFSQ